MNQTESKPQDKKRSITKIILTTIFILIIIGLSASSFFFYTKFRQEQNKNPQNEISNITSAISKHMVLPNEVPTIATVTNKDELQKNALFNNAEVGDKVLIFVQSKKAIVYRPSTKKIIETLPIQTTDNKVPQADLSTTTEPEVEEEKILSIALYNGSSTVGLTTNAEDFLKENFTYLNVSQKDNASENYEQSVVVDISGDNDSLVQKLAKEFSAKILELPEEETPPDPKTDLLIIIGEDYKVSE